MSGNHAPREVVTLAPFYPVVVQTPNEDFFAITKELTNGPIISAKGKGFGELRNAIRDKHVHAHGRGFPFPEAAGLFAKKAVYTPHNDTIGSSWHTRVIRKFLFNRFAKIVCQTEYGKEQFIREGICPEKLTVIPSAVDYDFFSKPSGGAAFRKKYNLPKTFALAIGLRPLKHPEVMAAACKEAGIDLVLIGPSTEEEVKKTWQQDGFSWYVPAFLKQDHVHLVGQLPATEVRAAFDAATMFLNSSLYESFGLAVYEAAASGLPLCLPHYGSFRGFGNCALFHDYLNSSALAKNITHYLDNPKLRASNGAAAQRIAKTVDYKTVRAQFASLYSEVFR